MFGKEHKSDNLHASQSKDMYMDVPSYTSIQEKQIKDDL